MTIASFYVKLFLFAQIIMTAGTLAYAIYLEVKLGGNYSHIWSGGASAWLFISVILGVVMLVTAKLTCITYMINFIGCCAHTVFFVLLLAIKNSFLKWLGMSANDILFINDSFFFAKVWLGITLAVNIFMTVGVKMYEWDLQIRDLATAMPVVRGDINNLSARQHQQRTNDFIAGLV